MRGCMSDNSMDSKLCTSLPEQCKKCSTFGCNTHELVEILPSTPIMVSPIMLSPSINKTSDVSVYPPNATITNPMIPVSKASQNITSLITIFLFIFSIGCQF